MLHYLNSIKTTTNISINPTTIAIIATFIMNFIMLVINTMAL